MQQSTTFWIDARDKPGLLLAMMKAFKGDSLISFEGSLGHLDFFSMLEASTIETEVLKRQTPSLVLDFIILPLTEQTLPRIWKQLCEKDHLVHEGITHVQIESNGKLIFGGYDNFHKDCTIAYSDVSVELLEILKQKGIIRDYKLSDK